MAISYATEEAAIYDALQDGWTTTPIEFPNRKLNANGAAHISARINHQESFNAEIIAGPKNIRHPGLLTIDVRVPINSGWIVAMGYADTLAAVFRNQAISGVHFRAPTIKNMGPEDPWYRVQVDCPYWRDSIL